MLLCKPIDLDLVKEVDAYMNAVETIKYLQDVVNSIEERVRSGEAIDGLELVEGQKRRVVTDFGLEYLSQQFGRDFAYKQVEKPITITQLEKQVSQYEMSELVKKGVVTYKSSSPKIKINR